jgi:hypothetical protein
VAGFAAGGKLRWYTIGEPEGRPVSRAGLLPRLLSTLAIAAVGAIGHEAAWQALWRIRSYSCSANRSVVAIVVRVELL